MNELTKYVVTSTHFEGSITYRFGADGIIYLVKCETSVLPNIRHWFISNCPSTVAGLEAFVASWNEKGKAMKLVKLEGELTFGMMYERYALKKDRKRAEDSWNKLKDSDRLKAYIHLPKYEQYLRDRGTAKMELKTYLRSYIWND